MSSTTGFPQRPASEPALAWPSGLFFFSGAAALTYEVLWMRELSLLFGATAYAAAATLAAFFLGLAAGGRYWGRRAITLTHPLKAYAYLEWAVAVSAAGCFLILPLYRELYPQLFEHWRADPQTLLIAKFLLSLAALFPAAFFLGGTLPVMSQFVARCRVTLGPRVSLLYASNTLGAATGALLAGFYLPIRLGYRDTYLATMGLSAMVGFTAWISSRRYGRAEYIEVRGDASVVSFDTIALGDFAFLSGFLTLALQVLWTRMFAQVLQNSVYTFALILTACLLCLALGAGLASWLTRLRLAAVVGLFFALSFSGLLVAWTPFAFMAWTEGLQYVGAGLSWQAYVLRVSGMMALIIGPALVCQGLVFPLLIRLEGGREGHAGVLVGRLLALNTLGAIVGSLVAGFVLLDYIGLWASVRLLGVVYLLAALLLWHRQSALAPRLVAIPALGILLLVSALDVSRLPIVRVDPVVENESLMQVWESGAGAVAVVRHGDQFKIKVDNHYTLGGTGSAETEALQGSLPVLLRARPVAVHVLGLGTGISAGAVLRHPVDNLVVTELLPDVILASRSYFHRFHFGLFQDRRATVLAEDGRNYIAATREKYDVIVGDLFVPWQAGAGSLYTLEHFRTIRAHLNEDGLFMQWLPAYQISHSEFAIIARTLLAVFPQVTLWRGDFSPRTPILGLLAQARQAALPADAMLFSLRQDVTQAGGQKLLTHYVGRLDPLRGAFDAYPLNSEDRPEIEYRAPITQREQKLGRAQWLNYEALNALMEQVRGSTGGAADSYLAAVPLPLRRLPEAGMCLHRAGIKKQAGYLAAAERDQACYETIMKEAKIE